MYLKPKKKKTKTKNKKPATGKKLSSVVQAIPTCYVNFQNFLVAASLQLYVKSCKSGGKK
jgi:hypothetical protein